MDDKAKDLIAEWAKTKPIAAFGEEKRRLEAAGFTEEIPEDPAEWEGYIKREYYAWNRYKRMPHWKQYPEKTLQWGKENGIEPS